MNLVFLAPPTHRPLGGVKAIYQLADACDEIFRNSGSKAFVCHPNRFNFRAKWFDSKVDLRNVFFGPRLHKKLSLTKIYSWTFDAAEDVLVIPELWVRKYCLQLLALKTRYIILVQGGYLLTKGDRQELDTAYSAAELIMCVSEDTAACVSSAFPNVRSKIARFHLWVDSDKFRPAPEKNNWIAYMPRKLKRHSDLCRFFIGNNLPQGWEWIPLDKMSENEVAGNLARSKIFVSFNELEGLGLPPIEAALAGNFVVGYTGEGGKEFWWPNLFTEIHSGNLLALSQAVINLASKWSELDHSQSEHLRNQLADKFSKAAMLSDLQQALDRIA
jgi:glycosyltransferase involved in cell wall biosynthesis